MIPKLTSAAALKLCSHHHYSFVIPNIVASSIAVVFPSTLCQHTIMNKYIGNHNTLSTQTSYDDLEAAETVLNEVIVKIDNAPNSCTDICSADVDKLCRAGHLSTVEKLVECLRERQVYISRKVYDVLLVAASERSDIQLSFKVFKYLLLSDKSPISTSYVSFAKSFIGNEDRGRLVVFVNEILELAFSSVIVVNRIIYAFAECGQIDEALFVFELIKTRKCKADLYTYNTVLDILGRVGRVDEMLNEFASMKDAGIVPDNVSYNTLLNSLKKVGRLDICLVFLSEMDECGIEPDLRT